MKHEVASEEDAAQMSSSPQPLLPGDVAGQQPPTEPEDQDAPEEHDASPPEDSTLYSHPSGTQCQQNNQPQGQPYTGPAAQHMNNPPRPAQRAQENWEGPEDPALTPAKE